MSSKFSFTKAVQGWEEFILDATCEEFADIRLTGYRAECLPLIVRARAIIAVGKNTHQNPDWYEQMQPWVKVMSVITQPGSLGERLRTIIWRCSEGDYHGQPLSPFTLAHATEVLRIAEPIVRGDAALIEAARQWLLLLMYDDVALDDPAGSESDCDFVTSAATVIAAVSTPATSQDASFIAMSLVTRHTF